MARWLVKQEPSTYSYGDLEREGRTRWDGVHNALALRHLRAMKPGDQALFYHSGDERSCIGTMTVVSPPRPDPEDPRGSWLVEVEVGRRLARPVALAEIREDPAFGGFALLRWSRLSVVPVPEPMWRRLQALARQAAPSPATATPKGRVRRPAPRKPRAAARRTR